jgi:hypothetical protein
MKKLLLFSALCLAAAGVHAALPQPDLIAQLHFAGAQKITSAPNFTAFTNEFTSAEALALREQTADKLSVWLAGWLQRKNGVTVTAGAAKLRPLLDDLQTAEWFLDARAEEHGKPEVALALKLKAERVAIWQAGLKPFFPAATLSQSGGWLVFESGTGTQKLAASVLKKANATDAAWLSGDVNWPRLAQWYPKVKELGLPETQFQVTAPGANLRLQGKFLYPQNLSLVLEDWRMPTNTIHAPFVSFTAARGFTAWLADQSWFTPYGISPTPNQLFSWALPQLPFQTFAAVPVPDATNALIQVFPRLQSRLNNPQQHPLMPLTLQMATNEISLRGMPFASPHLDAISEPAGQFLVAGLFPNTPDSKPLPPQLFLQLAFKNLVYYHWENTAARLPQILQMSQLGLLVSAHKQLGGTSAAFQWIRKIGPLLGQTDTEIMQTGPDQLSFNRMATGGLTAAELYALGNWLEAPNFPGCDLRLPATAGEFNRPLAPAPAAPFQLTPH